MSIILKNATFINSETLEFKATHIKVEEGINGKIEFLNSLPSNDNSTIIDCTGKYVTKSFVCGHRANRG